MAIALRNEHPCPAPWKRQVIRQPDNIRDPCYGFLWIETYASTTNPKLQHRLSQARTWASLPCLGRTLNSADSTPPASKSGTRIDQPTGGKLRGRAHIPTPPVVCLRWGDGASCACLASHRPDDSTPCRVVAEAASRLQSSWRTSATWRSLLHRPCMRARTEKKGTGVNRALALEKAALGGAALQRGVTP